MSIIYCKYKGKIYSADLDDNKVEITSNIYIEGFKPYTDVLGNKHKDIFIKEVEIDDADLLLTQNVYIKYQGMYFEPFAGKILKSTLQNGSILIFTSSEEIAQKLNFTKREQFIFAKDILLDEVDEIKLMNKPISIFKNEEIDEIIIKKDKVIEWLEKMEKYA